MNEFIQSDYFIIDLNFDLRGIHASPASQYANETGMIPTGRRFYLDNFIIDLAY